MKSVLALISLVAIISTTSCKRTYVCECHDNNGLSRTYEIKANKKDADNTCEVSNRSYALQGGYCDLQ